jgi:hypothetical protein
MRTSALLLLLLLTAAAAERRTTSLWKRNNIVTAYARPGPFMVVVNGRQRIFIITPTSARARATKDLSLSVSPLKSLRLFIDPYALVPLSLSLSLSAMFSPSPPPPQDSSLPAVRQLVTDENLIKSVRRRFPPSSGTTFTFL